MKKTVPAMTETEALLEKKYGPERTGRIMPAAWSRYEQLCRENSADPKAVKVHTEGKIFPCLALYEGMQQAGIPKEEAAGFLDRSHSLRAEKDAKSIRSLCRIPGVYRLMPSIFKWMTVHNFGTAAGFAADFYPTGKDRCKFDMTKCLYCDVCRKYGCPELVVCFCHTDDVTDGHMHPRLVWNRSKIMGDGADVCDFDLFIRK